MAPIEQSKVKLGDILARLELVTDEQVEEALREQKRTGKRFGESLLSLGFVQEDDLCWALSSQLGLPFVAVTPDMVDLALLLRFPHEFLENHLVLPLVASDKYLSVVLADPTDEITVARMERISGCQLNVAVGTPSAILRALRSLLDSSEETPPIEVPPSERTVETSEVDVDFSTHVTPPVAKLLERAVEVGARIVHLDPENDRVRVRLRTDGKLENSGWLDLEELEGLLTSIREWIGAGEAPSSGITVWNVPAEGGWPRRCRMTVVEGTSGPSLTLQFAPTGRDRTTVAAAFEPEWNRVADLLNYPRGLILAGAPTSWERDQLLVRILGSLTPGTRRAWLLASDTFPPSPNLIRFAGAPTRESADHLARVEGIDVLAGSFDSIDPARPLLEAASGDRLVIAVVPANAALGLIGRFLEKGASPTVLSEALLAVISQRTLVANDETSSLRAVAEILFTDVPLRRALQDGGRMDALRSAARAQDFIEIRQRARDHDPGSTVSLDDLDRHGYLEEAA